MALALQAPSALVEVMPKPSSINPEPLIISSEPRSQVIARHRDAHLYGYEGLSPLSSPLSPEESDGGMPLSPMVFTKNEVYERSRLSYVPPMPPRPSSTPPSPTSAQSLSPISPVVFSQHNLSSPSINLRPPPAFPTAGTPSLALRLKRPLPPLPRNVTDDEDDGPESVSRQRSRFVRGGSRPSPSSSNDRDSDTVSFSPAPSSSRSSATTISMSGSSDSIASFRAVEAFPAAETKPKVAPLTIPSRPPSVPIPSGPIPAIGTHITSPYISVTPASPLPPQRFTFDRILRERTASSTSLVQPSPYEGPEETVARTPPRSMTPDLPPRAISPAPSLTPSVSSTRSVLKGGMATLRRITSKTRLFGRRTLSSASEPWDLADDDETIVGHGQQSSYSMDDRMLRPRVQSRPDTPSTLGGEKRSVDGDPRPPLKRLEIAEVTRTSEGDVWQPMEICDVIPKLRELRLPSKSKM